MTTIVPVDFAGYVRARRPALLRAALGIARDPHAAEDLLQSALARVGPRWDTLRDVAAADAYVRRAMVNQHHSWCREPWRRRELVTDDLPEPLGTDAAPPLVRGDRRLWDLVLALPPRQRAVVALRYYEGLGEAETAAVLGCSRGTVKSSTSRGLASLRRRAGGLRADLEVGDAEVLG